MSLRLENSYHVSILDFWSECISQEQQNWKIIFLPKFLLGTLAGVSMFVKPGDLDLNRTEVCERRESVCVYEKECA